MHDALTLLPLVDARRRLGSVRIALAIVVPPYAALGVGELRVVRVRDRDGALAIDAAYERYERCERAVA